MAEVSEGIVATSSNNKTSQDGVEVVVDKRSLGSDGQVDSSQVTAEAEPAAKKLKTEVSINTCNALISTLLGARRSKTKTKENRHN